MGTCLTTLLVIPPWHYFLICLREGGLWHGLLLFLQTLDGQGFWMEVMEAILCVIILHAWELFTTPPGREPMTYYILQPGTLRQPLKLPIISTGTWQRELAPDWELLKPKSMVEPGIVGYACHLITREAEAEGLIWVKDQPWLTEWVLVYKTRKTRQRTKEIMVDPCPLPGEMGYIDW